MPKTGETTNETIRLKIRETKQERRRSGYYKIVRKCDFCGQELKYWQKRFCSLKHKGLYFSGSKHPCYTDGLSISFISCLDCGRKISSSNKSKRCRACLDKFQVKENSIAWKGGISVAYCCDCGVIIGGGSKRCLHCFIEHNKGENNAMFGRSGEKGNRWKKDIKENFCGSCGRKLNRGSNSKVCSKCYRGEFTPFWKGGLSKICYSEGFTTKLKRQIKCRDDLKCQSPFCKEEIEKYHLCVHHIDYDKNNHSIYNLITLCNPCHSKTHFNRLFWKDLFKQMMNQNLREAINE